MNDKGGSVTFIIQDGLDRYDSAQKNQIKSNMKSSYVSSFRLLGSHE